MVHGHFKQLGVQNDYTTKNREYLDYYASPPDAVKYLLQKETFQKNIWEPMCGEGHVSEVLKEHGYNVTSSDITQRSYKDMEIKDFMKCDKVFDGDIISNPPYKNLIPLSLKALELSSRKVAYLLKIQALESISRYEKLWKKHPPKICYIFVRRIGCARNGVFDNKGSAVSYMWVVWDKDYNGPTMIDWINNTN